MDARVEGTLAHRVLERIAPSCGGGEGARGAASLLLSREGVTPAHERHDAIVARVCRFLASAYARRIATRHAAIAREQPFVLEIPDGYGRALVLRGTIDLVVEWPNGDVDVVDYKRPRGPLVEPYAFQLDMYSLAAQAEARPGARVRAGIVFLGGDDAEPIWRGAPPGPLELRAHAAALAGALMEARWTESYPRVPLERCRAIRCGYAALCHPG
jgi:ATP-dependent helicase/nuclease subunit A